jgi:uncharacterized membrane protein YraQ (UPF0718 family)
VTVPARRLWFAARLTSALAVAVVAILFLSSWALAVIVGSVTIIAVVIDGLLLARSSDDQVALDPSLTTNERLTVDLRHRR